MWVQAQDILGVAVTIILGLGVAMVLYGSGKFSRRIRQWWRMARKRAAFNKRLEMDPGLPRRIVEALRSTAQNWVLIDYDIGGGNYSIPLDDLMVLEERAGAALYRTAPFTVRQLVQKANSTSGLGGSLGQIHTYVKRRRILQPPSRRQPHYYT